MKRYPKNSDSPWIQIVAAVDSHKSPRILQEMKEASEMITEIMESPHRFVIVYTTMLGLSYFAVAMEDKKTPVPESLVEAVHAFFEGWLAEALHSDN